MESVAREARLYRMVESACEGICEVDADGRCTYINAVGAHLLGYEAAELVGGVLHDAIHPSGRFLAPAECSICQALKNSQALETGNSTRRTQAMLSHKCGRALPVSYSVVPIGIDGAPQGALMTFSDDSERRRLESELRQLTAELAEAERRKTELIATLAHELRNPLAPIRNALHVMRKVSDNAT